MKNYDILVETKHLHRLEATGETEQEAISRALDLLDTEISLSNRNVTYNVFEVILKDEYL